MFIFLVILLFRQTYIPKHVFFLTIRSGTLFTLESYIHDIGKSGVCGIEHLLLRCAFVAVLVDKLRIKLRKAHKCSFPALQWDLTF